ncbi:hypothetical protein SS05631_d64970 (plasmid) [Sinorhizobium sp. CCBAU 05631]|nr:hypothetical protein SS05631_d64970 [Sinorhizobium sp. CCBAU 05631]
MTLPKYLRPIRDLEAHKLSATEKAVRMVIFTPFLILFSMPRGVLFALPLGLIFAFQLLPVGIDSIIHDPKTYRLELTILLAVGALLIFSNSIAKAIRRYFLPFG